MKLAECENKEGDLYDKAIVLLKGLVQKHPFASGNRRTAFIAAKDFVMSNKGKFGIQDDPKNAKVMQGAREKYYSDEELKEWIRNGKIREFKR
jgi:death-on-curing family protein